MADDWTNTAFGQPWDDPAWDEERRVLPLRTKPCIGCDKPLASDWPDDRCNFCRECHELSKIPEDDGNDPQYDWRTGRSYSRNDQDEIARLRREDR